MPVPADQFITATATDDGDNTSEFSPAVQVGGPPVIVSHPVGTAVTPGTPVTFCATAIGSQPLVYQWRRNGANIPGATNTCLTIENAELMDGGSYTVIVANDLGVITSDPAVLRLILPPVRIADNFVDRVPLTGASGREPARRGTTGSEVMRTRPGQELGARRSTLKLAGVR